MSIFHSIKNPSLKQLQAIERATQPTSPCDLEALAFVKSLPSEWLVNEFGLEQSKKGEIAIPCYDITGNFVRARVRTRISAKEGTRWQSGGKGQCAYNANRLDRAQKSGFLVLVEGETDTWTLHYHGFPVLGIPGANNASVIEPEHIECLEKIFVVREPGTSGEQFIPGVITRLEKLNFKGNLFELQMPKGIKDPSDLHIEAMAHWPRVEWGRINPVTKEREIVGRSAATSYWLDSDKGMSILSSRFPKDVFLSGPERFKMWMNAAIFESELRGSLPVATSKQTRHDAKRHESSRDNREQTWSIVPTSNGNGKLEVAFKLGEDVLHVDRFDPSSARSRKQFIVNVENKFPDVITTRLEEELVKLAICKPEAETKPEERKESGEEYPADIREEAEQLLTDPAIMGRIEQDIAAIGVAGEQELAMTVYLVGTSRILDKPLSLIVQGPSSSGKSYIVEKVSELMPPDEVLKATQMTPKALFYMEPGSLVHRLVVAGERTRIEDDEKAEATRALREMLSAGRLTMLVPIIEGNVPTTKLIEQDGPIAFIETTTLQMVMNEDANRCLMIHTDERETQTGRIIRQAALAYSGDGVSEDVKQRIRQRHHCLQSMLEPLPVVIPYASRVGELFPKGNVESRRAFPQLMSMIQVVCLLHQRQRARDEQGRLIAIDDDYGIARQMMLKPISKQQGAISDGSEKLYHAIEERDGGEEFTTQDAKKWGKVPKSTIYGRLAELNDAGLIEQTQPGKGKVPAKWKRVSLTDDAASSSNLAIPSMNDVFPSILIDA